MCGKMYRLLATIFIPICLILASCDLGPKDPDEMLALILREASRRPKKAMAAYTKAGQEGRAALVRVYFNIKLKSEPYYQRSQDYGFDDRGVLAFMEKLSEDPEFLRGVLAVSDSWPRDPAEGWRRGKREAAAWSPRTVKKRPNELEWVLAHDADIYAAWLAALPVGDPRLGTAWELYIARHSDKGMDAFLAMLAGLPAETTYARGTIEEALERLASRRDNLTPAQLRFIFTNRMESRFFGLWKLDPKAWLLAFPEDLGFALWRDTIETNQLIFAIPWETLREEPVTPERGKALIVFDEPGVAPHLSASLMRKALTKESAADSLYRYDRRVEISLSRVNLFQYFADVTMPNNPSWINGVRSDLTVSCRESRTGKQFWARTFQGGRPPKETFFPPGGVRYVSGNVPWEEAYAAVRECAAR